MTTSADVELFQARDGVTIAYRRWLPDTEVRAAVQIVHGASEHSGRYGRLAGALTDRGIAVYAMDLRGHGHTAQRTGAGRFGSGNADTMVDDVLALDLIIADRHPGRPRVLLGHSMGSIIALAAAEKHGQALAALVLSGALGVNDHLPQRVSALEAAVDAGMGEQPFDLGTNNQAFEPARTRYDWLSRDAGEVDAYIADPLCGDDMPLTYAYAAGVFGLSVRASSPQGVERLPDDLPILLLSGERDPVGGEAGAQVIGLARLMEKRGLPVQRRIYPDARHEVFNETNRDEVVADLVRWLEHRTTGRAL
jgi:alpha-beta hydrolase superfamily lysophospholipase